MNQLLFKIVEKYGCVHEGRESLWHPLLTQCLKRGWSCVLNCLMLSSLPCYPAFCWSAIPTSSNVLLVLYAVLAEESLTRLSSNTKSTMDENDSPCLHAHNQISQQSWKRMVSLLSDLCVCVQVFWKCEKCLAALAGPFSVPYLLIFALCFGEYSLHFGFEVRLCSTVVCYPRVCLIL